MDLLKKFLSNYVFTNLTFGLVLIIGAVSYIQMPREKDPEINFNWVNILTYFPGASATDVEKRITNPIEDTIRRTIQDLRFVSSTSRAGVSSLLLRFEQIDDELFSKRIADLRREIQNTYTDELPEEIDSPYIYEVTTSNAFPSASVIVTSAGNDENLRKQAHNIKKDIELIKGVDRVNELGLSEPELHIRFIPERLEGIGISPSDLTDTIKSYFNDIAAGDIVTKEGQWIVRIEGANYELEQLANYPVITAKNVIPLGNLVELVRATKEPDEIVNFNKEPAVLLAVTKQSTTNVLKLIDRINEYIKQRNELSTTTGVKLHLVDDQTISTRNALRLMKNNALIGLLLVLAVTFIFLGGKISILTSIGIPFTLAGTFIILNITGITLNNMVLLGTVISLGMLVDDAVVVVEAIYYQLQQGQKSLTAATNALKEVFAPVTTSVLTTMAAFLPLMLLPGILGEFMKVIPMVVTIALAISLIEAYWILPVHIVSSKININKNSKIQELRNSFNHWIRIKYTRLLLKAFRHPIVYLFTILLIISSAITTVANGFIRINFFESDAIRLFYVNIEMPRYSTLEQTNEKLNKIEKKVLAQIKDDELRASVVYAGQQFTETEPLFGDAIGQIMVSLNPSGRHVHNIADEVEKEILDTTGVENIYLLRMKDGPPTTRPISVKVRGDKFDDIKNAANTIADFLKSKPLFSNISTDYRSGNPELVLNYDGEAIKRTGINPVTLSRSIQAYIDGEIITDFQYEGEKIKLRLIAKDDKWSSIDELLRQTISVTEGKSIAIGELVTAEQSVSQHNIKHYNFRRTITVEADINKDKINTVEANNLIKNEWLKLQKDFPNIDIDFSGELDDIKESIDAIGILFLLGLGLIYIILGTQFISYWQPFMIIATVPLAFTGVVLGLLVTNNPLSLYTLYGVVALAGISVNASIVMISAGNDRLKKGMSILHATIYSARRRVIPILVTSLTTIAGLFSLAIGLGGESLIWGPVATAIVWGLAFSTVLTLFVIPLLFRFFMNIRKPS